MPNTTSYEANRAHNFLSTSQMNDVPGQTRRHPDQPQKKRSFHAGTEHHSSAEVSDRQRIATGL